MERRNMPLYEQGHLSTQAEKKTKKTRQKPIHVEHVTNPSPFDKSMIYKSEDLKWKYMLLGGEEEKSQKR